jgi:hypothetical protein
MSRRRRFWINAIIYTMAICSGGGLVCWAIYTVGKLVADFISWVW